MNGTTSANKFCFITLVQNNFHGSRTVFTALAKKLYSFSSVVKTYQGTSFCLVWINRELQWVLAPDKASCKVVKKKSVCLLFCPSYFSKNVLNALPACCIFWLLLCFLFWQRVVKADIVNYSQEPVTRTVNPPRSSMCAVQWPRCSYLVWYLCSPPALTQALGLPGTLF